MLETYPNLSIDKQISQMTTLQKKFKKINERKNPESALMAQLRLLVDEVDSIKKNLLKEVEKAMKEAKAKDIFKDIDGTKDVARTVAQEEIASFKTLVNDRVESTFALIKEKTDKFDKKMEDGSNANLKEAQKMFSQATADASGEIMKMVKFYNKEFADIVADLETKRGPKGDPGKDAKGEKGEPGKDADPKDIVKMVLKEIKTDTGDEIIKKINTAKTEKIKMSVIEGLASLITELRNAIRIAGKKKSGGSSGGGGDVVRYYDISSDLDGVTKVFTIPKNQRVLWVGGTDAPGGQYRQTTDYTRTATTLTLTSEVIAPLSGSTLHINYIAG